MTTTEQYQDLVKVWTNALEPADRVEEDIVKLIASNDFLISLSKQYALKTNNMTILMRELRNQVAKTRSIGAMLRMLQQVQRERRARHAPQPPPKSPAKAQARVIPFPSAAAFGRPRKVQLEAEPVPSLDPFRERRKAKSQRGAEPSVDFKIAA